MTKQQFMAISQNTGLKCELIYLEMGESFSTKIKPVTGFSIEKTDICDYMVRFGFSDQIEFRTEKTFKPILRPLSDLTREITHNGETFRPLNKLVDLYGYEIQTWKNNILAPVKTEPFNVVCQLVEWHFDIAELIDKDEAVDIHTLSISYY
jgi:hypothetical protein